jgi:Ca2+-binding RTX toxin-like protein
MLAVLAIAALGIGSLSAVALAGRKNTGNKTTVNFDNQSPNFNSGKVSANGAVVSHCGVAAGLLLGGVSMRLQVLDTNGVVLTTLDSSTSESDPIVSGPAGQGSLKGRWTLSGQLPTTLPAGTNYVRVKAEKQTIRLSGDTYNGKKTQKLVCHAGFSPTVAIPAAQTSPPTPPGQAPPPCNGLTATIVGTEGRDRLIGTPGPDVIVGQDGDDTVIGNRGNDVICGGDGWDSLTGGQGKDTLLGQAGRDNLSGGNGKDRCAGGKGNDLTDWVCEVEKSIETSGSVHDSKEARNEG